MGKKIRVSEFDLKFGADDHMLDVYAVFKEEKRGDVLVIYSDLKDENKSTLHYASVHLKEDGLVFIDVKDKEEIIKEFTWKLLNNKQNEGFKTFDISKYDKAEIVSSNSILVKPEVIKTLHDKTIPKQTAKEEKKTKKKKMNSSTKILLTGFTLAFLVIVAFLVTNKDLLMGTSIKYECINSYLDTNIGSNKKEIQELTFNFKDELTTRTIITKYKFSNQDDYKEYDNAGTYFDWEKKFMNSTLEYERDEANLVFNIIEHIVLDKYYSGNTNKQDLLSELTNSNYECQDVSE